MKNKFFCALLFIMLLFISGCNNDLSRNVIGTYKEENVNWYLVLYEGGTGVGYSDADDFKKNGYAPQSYKWEINDGIINITNTLVNKTEGYKYDSDNNTLTAIDEKTIFVKID